MAAAIKFNRLEVFQELGVAIGQIPAEIFDPLAVTAGNENPWFTPENVRLAFHGIATLLEPTALTEWTRKYNTEPDKPRWVAVIPAGNIPLVSFHDILCVLISGHRLILKVSSKDRPLTTYLIDRLCRTAPQLAQHIRVVDGPLKGFDGAIATGSDNSARYFEYYFSRFPSIIRKNRVSVAVLHGRETHDELRALGSDVFSYFGLGCRNVAKLMVPKDYEFPDLFSAWSDYARLMQHHKYANNYEYRKSILLLNRSHHFDTGFLLLEESTDLVSPIAMLYYEHYDTPDDLASKLNRSSDKIQCVVGRELDVPFGRTQLPGLNDYADHVDTMHFLESGFSTVGEPFTANKSKWAQGN